VSAQPGDLEARLAELVRSSALLMDALAAAREVDPPDWLIGAGAIRDLVWDHVHGCREPHRPKDVDLVFYDDASGARSEQSVLDAVRALAPNVPWDVHNQATVHLWYPEAFGVEVDPLASSADAVATWPETASAVAIRLLADDALDVVAPFGLEDLFGLVWRRNSRRVTTEEYVLRIGRKQVASRWPRARVLLD
jgi:hypothetical protein